MQLGQVLLCIFLCSEGIFAQTSFTEISKKVLDALAVQNQSRLEEIPTWVAASILEQLPREHALRISGLADEVLHSRAFSELAALLAHRATLFRRTVATQELFNMADFMDSNSIAKGQIPVPNLTFSALVTICISFFVLLSLLVVTRYRLWNRSQIQKGKHAFRGYRDCTKEELARNSAYMNEKGMWNPENVLWQDRKPPTSNCKYVKVLRHIPFVGDSPEVTNSLVGRSLLSVSRLHPLIVYYDDPTNSDVFVSEMCHDWFCDVPESIPSLPYYQQTTEPTVNWVLYVSAVIPISVCGYSEHRAVIESFGKLEPTEYDCQLMFQAEKNVYHRWNWDIGWVAYFHDCVQYMDAVLEEYERLSENTPE